MNNQFSPWFTTYGLLKVFICLQSTIWFTLFARMVRSFGSPDVVDEVPAGARQKSHPCGTFSLNIVYAMLTLFPKTRLYTNKIFNLL
ncbi:MAG: hypothetical protein LBN74_05570 [Prevotella sp.]|nr:hypothetical protein [Prevotella sp.]